MLGPERRIKENFVATGQAKVAFSPITDLGPGSLNSAAAAYCIGAQNPAAFWLAHDAFFDNPGFVFSARQADYAMLAEDLDVDANLFNTCYENGDGHGWASERDSARRQADVFSRPTIDINGFRLFGVQAYEVYAAAIEATLGR